MSSLMSSIQLQLEQTHTDGVVFLKEKNIILIYHRSIDFHFPPSFLVGLHVLSGPRQLRHGNESPAGGMGETKDNVQREKIGGRLTITTFLHSFFLIVTFDRFLFVCFLI